MRSSTQSSNADRPQAPVDPQTCFFTRTALLALPPRWRIPMIHVGQALFDIALEVFGIAAESKTSLESTSHRLIAFAGDLKAAADELAATGTEPESTQMGERERRLCKLAGRFAPQVREISRTLMDAGRGIGPIPGEES